MSQSADGNLPQSTSRSGSPSASQETLTLRALVGTKEAGIIIGKAGKNVADLREQTGVKAGVSKVVTGVHERVLSVSGSVQGVAKVSVIIVDIRRQQPQPISHDAHFLGQLELTHLLLYYRHIQTSCSSSLLHLLQLLLAQLLLPITRSFVSSYPTTSWEPSLAATV